MERVPLLKHWYLLIMVLLLVPQCVLAKEKTKKLIEFGWDRPKPSYVLDHLSAIEKLPFNGITMSIPPINKVMSGRRWSKADAAAEFAALPDIRWKKLTDNFVLLNLAGTVDWFNDEDWDIVVSNIKLLAEAARLGNCRGILLDAEPYAVVSPWWYKQQAQAADKSFAEYGAQVRRRGRQCMEAIQSELPSPVILCTFLTSILSYNERRSLADAKYGLIPKFLDGMLDTANPGTVIVDGNEAAYNYESKAAFVSARQRIQEDGLTLLSPENRERFKTHVQSGQAVFIDRLFGTQGKNTVAYYLKPEEQLRWFKANLYYALKNSDEYAWLYSNKPNWWEQRDLPAPDTIQIIDSVRKRVKRGSGVGKDIPTAVQRARQKLTEIRAKNTAPAPEEE